MKFRIRNTEPRDFAEIIELSAQIYRQKTAWTVSELESHLNIFPEGQFVAEEIAGGRIVGMSASLVVLWNDYEVKENWEDFTDCGLFTNHDIENGRTLYGAEVMVSPEIRRSGVGKRLYDVRKKLVKRLGLLRIRAGARLRNYHRYAGKMNAHEYVELVKQGKLKDPTLSFQLKQGFEVIAVVSGYLPDDPESLGKAAVIEWRNPEKTS